MRTKTEIFFSDRSAGAAGAVAGGNHRRQRLAQDFLLWLDQTGELLSLAERQEWDPVKQERMEVRGDRGVSGLRLLDDVRRV